ncbi:hypothetical protein PsorP6_007590 [Peronosclerospora sorghi]|uniref:Uncharacterized protein n=1 Tax=Peronosclerospora sorghi TaxID=230839 RepID=A0ACC0WB67_9STRA|nr:hypothetical protein PsorP6_007590 [Peronosclerospora sorghi]
MGEFSSVRKLTVDSIALLEMIEPKSVKLAAKRSVRLRVQQLLKQQWPTCRILPFGSSQGYASSMHKRSQNEGIVIACDLCVGGVNALLNTALLKFYGQVDPRVRLLVFAVKYWAKQRGINDSVNGTLSSYGESFEIRDNLFVNNVSLTGVCLFPSPGYTLLLIFYLLSHYAKMQLPAVHSSFHDLQSDMKVSELLQRLQSFPRTELASTFGITKPNSVGALLERFFDYYAHRFNLEDEVVSVRIGSALSNTTK